MIDTRIKDLLALTPIENKVLFAIEKTPLNMSGLAVSTKIPRTTLYTAIDSLKKRGLISTRKIGKAVVISPTPKETIRDMLAEASSVYDADGNTKIIKKHDDGKRSGFTVVSGKKAMLKVWEGLAQRDTKRFYAIQPTRSMVHTIERFKPGEFIPINNAIKKNRIIVDAILKEDSFPTYMEMHKREPNIQRDIVKSFIGRMAETTLIRNEYLNNNAEIYITSRSAFLMNWEQEIGIKIENKDMIDLLTEMFQLAKSHGKKIDLNEYMRGWLEKIEKQK